MSTHDDLYNPHDHEPMPEGEEEAPPMTRTMSLIRWVLLGLMTGFALVMLLGWFGLNPLSSSEAGTTQYHCPMHPTYVSSQPGDCPICGMSLVPIKPSDSGGSQSTANDSSHAGHDNAMQSTARPGQYTCPMDPEIVSDTAGKCPKCGMYLEQVPVLSKARPGQYACPMCPEIISDTAADCSICGMPLEQVPPGTGSSAHSSSMVDTQSSSPVPGLVTITLDPKRTQMIGIKTGIVDYRSLGSSLKLAGYVTPDESKVTDLHLRINGWVKKLYINKTGEQVDAGAPLLTIYSQDLYQTQQDLIIAAKAKFRSGDQALAQMRNQLYDAARQRLALLGLSETEILSIEASGAPSAELTLKSPLSGVVLEKSVAEGQYVGPDQNLFTIADLRTVWVLADVYEQDLTAIAVGTPVTVRGGASNAQLTGKVNFVYPTVSSETRTAKVRVEFANSTLELRPGMFVDLDLTTNSDSALVVPSDAVMDGGATKYVFVVRNGVQFEPRLITSGRTSDNWYEVLTGVRQGEMVVTSANFLIDSESRLQAAITGMGGTQTEPQPEHAH